MKQQQTINQFVELQKNVTSTKKIFKNKQNSVDQNGYQTDQNFAKRIVQLKEKTQMLNQDIFAKRADLTDEQFQMIQKIGDLHYQCQLANESSSKDLSKWPKEKKCVCGCNRGSGQSLPYCTNIEDTTFFGPGVLLFFFYSKRILILILFAVIVYGIYALTTNIIGDDFHHDCVTSPSGIPFMCDWIRMASVKNKSDHNDLQIVQAWLAIPVFLFWAIGIRILRNLGRKKNSQIDQKLDSSSDYCIWIEDLPSGKYHEADLVKYLAKLWRMRKKKSTNNPKMVIKSVQIIYLLQDPVQIYEKIREIGNNIYDMYEIQEIQEKPENQELQIQKDQQERGSQKQKQKQVKIIKKYKVLEDCREDYEASKKQLDDLQTELKLFRKSFIESSDFRKKITHQAALVEFYHQENCDQILENYGKFQESKFKELKNQITSCCQDEENSVVFHGRTPKIIRAPEPSDINWANSAKEQNMLRVMAVWGINLLLIGASFGSLMLFRYLATISQTIREALFIKIIILNLFNRIIWNILNMVISIEQNKTKTEQIASVMNKSYLGQSCNIIVLPLIMNMVFNDNLYGPNGLSGAVHDYQLTVFLFMILFNLINIPHRLTQLLVCLPCTRRFLIKYFCRVTDKFNSMEQIKQALAFLYQPPKLPLAGLYVYIITTTNQAFFFCYLQPINLFYLLGNLVLFFLINKFLLLKQCKIPDLLDFFIFESILIMAMNVPLFYAVGSTVILALGGKSDIIFYIPGIIVFILWFLCSQNPFNIFSKFITCIQECIFLKKQQVKPQNISKEQTIQQEVLESQVELQESEDVQSVRTNVRRQNYYSGGPMKELFNFQSKLGDCVGPYHNKFKQFCQIFHFNMSKKGRKKIIVEDI